MKKLVTLLLVLLLILSSLSLSALAADPVALGSQSSPYSFTDSGSGTLTQNYQLTEGDYAYTDVTQVDVAWEITNVAVTFAQKTMVWDAENLEWTESDSQSQSSEDGITVTPGMATFTITNYSSVSVMADVQFEPETQFATNATWSFNEGTAKAAYSGTIDTVVKNDKTVSEGDAPFCTVNATVTTDSADFKNLTETDAEKFGAYTVTITSLAGILGSSDTNTDTNTDTDTPYLTFTGNDTFMLSTTKTWDGSIQYATTAPDTESSWSTWDGTEITANADSHKIYLRGKNTNISTSKESYAQLSMTGDATAVNCSGNIMTLLDYEDPDKATLTAFCFCRLFRNCTKLTSVPTLPATSLADSCYSEMFKGCTSLTSAPQLLATELCINCYADMFNGCTSLKVTTESGGTLILTVPAEVPAGAMDRIFYDCALYGSAKATPEGEGTYYYLP